MPVLASVGHALPARRQANWVEIDLHLSHNRDIATLTE